MLQYKFIERAKYTLPRIEPAVGHFTLAQNQPIRYRHIVSSAEPSFELVIFIIKLSHFVTNLAWFSLVASV